jgi:hypothetical protein
MVLAAGAGTALFFAAPLRAEYPEPVVVSADVSRDYHRVRLADGTFRREMYAFVKGSRIPTDGVDLSLDHLNFVQLAHMLAPTLAKAGYLPESNPRKIELMIMVHWGMTAGSEDTHNTPGMDNLSAVSSGLFTTMPLISAAGGLNGPMAGAGGGAMRPGGGINPSANAASNNALNSTLAQINFDNHNRDDINGVNARILGMDDGVEKAHFAPNLVSSRDTMGELELDRDYVVLQAFDFQKSWKENKLKLLWETRFSIRAPGRHFDQQLPTMLLAAGPYFGQDTHGMRSRMIPNGNVEVGVPRVVGTVPDPNSPAH